MHLFRVKHCFADLDVAKTFMHRTDNWPSKALLLLSLLFQRQSTSI